MSDADAEWEENNARQLSAALTELRERLERLIEKQSGKPPAASPASPLPSPPPRPPGTPAPHPAPRPLPQLPVAPPALPAPTDDADAATPAAESRVPVAPPPALSDLAERLGLSAFEQNVLLLCAAMELDTRIPGLCARAHDGLSARAQDDPAKPFPTFALALSLFDEPAWDVLSPERPLRYWRLIEINQPGAQSLTASPLRADERIVNYLKGLNYLDDRVAPFLAPLELHAGTAELAPSQSEIVESILRLWEQASATGPLPVVQLLGADAISKQLVAQHAAAQVDRHVHRMPVELLPTAPADLETLARLWQREIRLLPLTLYLDAEDLDGAGAAPERSGLLRRFLARSDGVFFLGVREAAPRLGRATATLDVAKPTPAEQQSAWTEELGNKAPESPALLAAQFDFNLPDLRRLARLAQAEAESAPESLGGKIWDLCRTSERPQLDTLAQRLNPKMTWADLVLPDAEMKLLHQIVAQVGQRNRVYTEWGFARKMNRGFGISALFAGGSGTGKTMAAEVIANELHLDVYRIDLSAVMDKYIGGTEKNLCRLFDAAERGGAILFFDEADALFGKRSEVKDSHDRYANIEINYLLQRIEAYRGLAILATNMKSALDSAFLRRLRFIVNFPVPVADDRKQLWKKVLLQDDIAHKLPTPPLGRLDYDRLARLNLTGGEILNVALNACFMAAERKTKVTMPLVLEAARAEYLKLERPINEADFRWTEPAPATPSSQPPTMRDEALLV